MSDCYQGCKVCGYRHDVRGEHIVWCHKCGACMLSPGPQIENAILRLEAEKAELCKALRDVVGNCEFCGGVRIIRGEPKYGDEYICKSCTVAAELLAKHEKTGEPE